MTGRASRRSWARRARWRRRPRSRRACPRARAISLASRVPATETSASRRMRWSRPMPGEQRQAVAGDAEEVDAEERRPWPRCASRPLADRGRRGRGRVVRPLAAASPAAGAPRRSASRDVGAGATVIVRSGTKSAARGRRSRTPKLAAASRWRSDAEAPRARPDQQRGRPAMASVAFSDQRRRRGSRPPRPGSPASFARSFPSLLLHPFDALRHLVQLVRRPLLRLQQRVDGLARRSAEEDPHQSLRRRNGARRPFSLSASRRSGGPSSLWRMTPLASSLASMALTAE